MKLSGIVLRSRMVKDSLGSQVPIYQHIGYKIEGDNNDFRAAGLSINDAIITNKQNVAYLSIQRVVGIARNLLPIDGISSQTGEITGTKKLNDYPISLCNPTHYSPVEFAAEKSNIAQDSTCLYVDVSNNGSADVYFNTSINNTPRHDSMYLLRKIVGKRTIDGKDAIFGYEVCLSQNGGTKPVNMSIESIAENAQVLKPKNFIVTSKNGELVLKGLKNQSLKDLPTLQLNPNSSFALKSGATARVAGNSQGKGLADVCSVLQHNDAYFIRIVGESRQEIEGTNGTLYLSGIQVARPYIDYSWSSLNSNFKFTCLATVMGTTPTQVPVCYSRNRSLFNAKHGALALLEHIYIMVDKSNKDSLLTELASIGIEASENISDKIKANLPLINMGLLGGNNYVVVDADLSNVSVLSKDEVAKAKSVDMFELLKQKQINRGLAAYLDSQLKKLGFVQSKARASSQLEQYYNQFPSDIQQMLDVLKIDRSTGMVNFVTDYGTEEKDSKDVVEVKSKKLAIEYSIPGVPEIISSVFAKKPLDEIIASNNKKAIKEEIYRDLFTTIKKYIVNYENILSSRQENEGYTAVVNYLAEEKKKVDQQIKEIKKLIWIYNQYAIKGVEKNIAVYDNGATSIRVDSKKTDTANVTRSKSNTEYLEYAIKLDVNTVNFSDRIRSIQ